MRQSNFNMLAQGIHLLKNSKDSEVKLGIYIILDKRERGEGEGLRFQRK